MILGIETRLGWINTEHGLCKRNEGPSKPREGFLL